MSSRTRQSLSAVLGLGLAVTALSLVHPPAAHAEPVGITLLDINDYHGRISSDGGSGINDATPYSIVELATTVQGIRARRRSLLSSRLQSLGLVPRHIQYQPRTLAPLRH